MKFVYYWIALFLLVFGFSACSENRSNNAAQEAQFVSVSDAAIDLKSTEAFARSKRIALTYDDAPMGTGPLYSGAERTRALISHLETTDAGPVAIFVTTRGLDKKEGRDRVADYAAAGHRIANHSDQHIWASQTSLDAYIADIDLAETKLAGFDNRRPWFRFPFLDEGTLGPQNRDFGKRDALRAALAERGLMSGYVTVDTYDWHLVSLWAKAVRDGAKIDMEALSKVYTDMVLDAAEHYDALGQTVLGRRPAHVLLLHENDLAAHFTTDLIIALREQGWTIIDPDQAFDDPIATQLPDTHFVGRGRISALASDQDLKGAAGFEHWSASRAGIEDRVERDGVFSK